MSTVFTGGASRLREDLESTLKYPARSSEFDPVANTNDVLSDVGLTAADSGGRLSFYGQDPIISSPHRFGAMAAIGLAAKSVAAAALWRARTGEGQDIHVDVRKALRRFCGFFDGKWETINGRRPRWADSRATRSRTSICTRHEMGATLSP